MPLNVLQVKEVVGKGLSPVCATCTHFWNGREKGLEFPKCTTPGPCGGPIAGLDFPYYIGPMTVFDRWCFACPQEAPFAIKIPDKDRKIGVCKTHLKLLDTMVLSSPGIEVYSSKGLIIPKNGRYTSKTLLEDMVDTEISWSNA